MRTRREQTRGLSSQCTQRRQNTARPRVLAEKQRRSAFFFFTEKCINGWKKGRKTLRWCCKTGQTHTHTPLWKARSTQMILYVVGVILTLKKPEGPLAVLKPVSSACHGLCFLLHPSVFMRCHQIKIRTTTTAIEKKTPPQLKSSRPAQ